MPPHPDVAVPDHEIAVWLQPVRAGRIDRRTTGVVPATGVALEPSLVSRCYKTMIIEGVTPSPVTVVREGAGTFPALYDAAVLMTVSATPFCGSPMVEPARSRSLRTIADARSSPKTADGFSRDATGSVQWRLTRSALNRSRFAGGSCS